MKNKSYSVALGVLLALPFCLYLGCNGNGNSSITAGPGQAAEVASSLVSGIVGITDNAAQVAMEMARPQGWHLPEFLFPIPRAHAYSITCQAGSFGACSGSPGSLTYTPPDCSADFGNGTATSHWTKGPFTLTVGTGTGGTNCDCAHGGTDLLSLGQNCTIATTTPDGGILRTLTGSNNNYVVSVSTANLTGYNTAIATNSSGIVTTCGAGGCAATRSIVVNGIQVNSTADGNNFWNNTFTTAAPLVVNGVGASRVLASGTLVAQNNNNQYLATTVFNGPISFTAGCCFPVSGSATVTFSAGPYDTQVETIKYGPNCGDAQVLPPNNGLPLTYILTHCI